MISWIQITFQRHFRVLFFVLLAVLIVSFVFTIGAAPGVGSGERQVKAQTFYDLNLNSPDDQTRLLGDASLSILLQAGRPNISNAQLQGLAMERYASLHLAKELNLPGPTEEQYTEYLQNDVRAFMGANGTFDASVYASFRDNLKLSDQFSEADVDRVLRDDYRVLQVQKLLGGPGYVLDDEVNYQLGRTDTVWSIDVVKLDYTTFAPTIEPSDDELQAYFDANSFRYETAPQVRVSYIEFPATRYLGDITLTEDQIRAYYEANPARFPRAAAEGETPAIETDPDVDYLAVRDQVSAAMRYDGARRLAAEAATQLTVDLFDAQPDADAIGTFVAGKGQTLRAAEAFDRNNPPLFLNTNPRNLQAAFNLSADDRISDAIPTAAGAVVLVWQESIPPAPSLYLNVADQVRTDYLENEKRERFVALGQRVQGELQTALGGGTSATDATTALDGLDGATASVESFSDFTLMSPPENFPGSIYGSLEGLQAGDVSDMVLLTNEGLLTHAAARTAPALTAGDARYEELQEQLAAVNAASTASNLLVAMIRAEREAGGMPAN